ncbi:MAG: hypothetical protein GW928_08105 [Rhodoferax sp.]|nr:hypothetical protein [Betaproteobacteria bacterium]NCN97391.1 hypothetical protein [Rhodoferax sp.]NCP82337.1 hypothetical protein [Rhodoferax sp.]NCS61457.1 hypothetical protein [Rhodoferax sp.]PJC19970.1 MAG: hypothetical protein CO065_06660 [Comamonadaceae bacterium CG_4_9_14_0_8_um_filter_57_21]
MHNAPAVTYPVGRSHVQASLLGVLMVCEILALLVWFVSVDTIGWLQVAACGLVALVCAFAWVFWWRTPQGQLSWNGSVWGWSWGTGSGQVKPELILDFQAAMCLRLVDLQSSRMSWVWPERRTCPTRWRALRRALHDSSGFKGPDTSEQLPTALSTSGSAS